MKRKHTSRGWQGYEISVTYCEDLAYKHVHCPCDQCCGKAVPTSTEYHLEKLISRILNLIPNPLGRRRKTWRTLTFPGEENVKQSNGRGMQFVPFILKICRTNIVTVLVISSAGKWWLLLRNIAIGSKTCIWIIFVTTGGQHDFVRVLTYWQKSYHFEFKVNITSLIKFIYIL